MRRQSKGYEIDMCNGTLANKILLFALPLMASSLLQLLFNAADVVVVGQFCGKASLAAVGSNTALINLLVNLFVGLSVGANVVVAQDLGARTEGRGQPRCAHLNPAGYDQRRGLDDLRRHYGPPNAGVDVLPENVSGWPRCI